MRLAAGSGRNTITLYAALLLANLAAWLWALAAFHDHPVLLGAAALAYALGLRHAVDADHIAAIDNVTRKLMQQGQRPASVGLYFSLGHSTVVVIGCALIAGLSGALRDRIAQFAPIGNLLGTGLSAAFLFAIALANLVTLASVWRALRGRGEAAGPTGLATRVLRPLIGLISRPSQMLGLGFLFGLGFDTATEIGLLAISAAQGAHDASPWIIMIFPALFAAGMSLIDTLDGALMVGAYGWALAEPRRKLRYNFAVTLISVLVALGVGAVEALGMATEKLPAFGGARATVLAISDHAGAVGLLIVASFALCWALSAALNLISGPNRTAG